MGKDVKNAIIEALKKWPMSMYELQQVTGHSFYCIRNNVNFLREAGVVGRKTVTEGRRKREVFFYIPRYYKTRKTRHVHEKN